MGKLPVESDFGTGIAKNLHRLNMGKGNFLLRKESVIIQE